MRSLRGVSSELLIRSGLAILVFGLFTVTLPGYATAGNLSVILDGFAFAGLAALGIGITIIAGEFDLSIGSMAAVAGVIAVRLSSLGLIGSVGIAVAIGVVFGVLQGLVIVRFQIHSLVFTVGTLIGLRGLAYVLSPDERTVTVPDLAIANAAKAGIGPFSVSGIATLLIFLLVGGLLAFHRWGRDIYAVGGGRTEAQAAGIDLRRSLALAFGFSAGAAALAGALVSLRSGSATPIGFENLLLPAATAALIGGVSLRGGKGTVAGIAVGALTIRFIVSGLSLQGAPFYVENLALGLLLLVVILLQLGFETPQANERWRRVAGSVSRFLRSRDREVPDDQSRV